MSKPYCTLFSITILLVSFGVLAPCTLRCSVDTLRHYGKFHGYQYFTDKRIVMVAERFELSAPGRILSVKMKFGGNQATGSGIIHLFGQDGGLPYPVAEKDLAPPIILDRPHAGVFDTLFTFVPAIDVSNNQFFVAFEKISGDIRLLSDGNATTAPSCFLEPRDYFYGIGLKYSDSGWQSEVFSFFIDVVVEFPTKVSTGYLHDVTSALGLPASLSQQSIAWGDFNKDSYLDLLIDGRLYRNDSGTTFTDLTTASGLTGSPAVNALIDMDNDGDLDILFLGSKVRSRTKSGVHELRIGSVYSGIIEHPSSGRPIQFQHC